MVDTILVKSLTVKTFYIKYTCFPPVRSIECIDEAWQSTHRALVLLTFPVVSERAVTTITY